MRYAILADIHSNLEALDAVLAALASERVDRHLCLGDLVGYGADPAACLVKIRALDAVVIGGNHDWGAIGKLDRAWFGDTARRALEWTRDQLSFGDLAYLRTLRLTQQDGPCTLVHGTLTRPERFEYLFDVAQALETARMLHTRCACVGHTHLPCVAEVDVGGSQVRRFIHDAPTLTAGVALGTEPSLRYVINPGSVGQPRDGDARASYAILDEATHTLTIRRVTYDIATAQRKIRAAGLPSILADRLAVGR